jgi:hypothetical protein
MRSNSGRVGCGALAVGGEGLRQASLACDGAPRWVHGKGALIRFCFPSVLPRASLPNSTDVI